MLYRLLAGWVVVAAIVAGFAVGVLFCMNLHLQMTPCLEPEDVSLRPHLFKAATTSQVQTVWVR